MRHHLEVVILFAWLIIPIQAAVFVIRFGSPGKYMEPTMAWHLMLTTAIAGLEPVGFLVQGFSLWPAAIIYVGSVAVMTWRNVLLDQEKRRAHKSQPNG